MNLIFIHLTHKYKVHIAVNFKLLQKNKELKKKILELMILGITVFFCFFFFLEFPKMIIIV